MVKTTAGIWTIARPQVSSFLILLPPFAEQHRIVAEVERRLSLIDELEAAIAANLKRADRLRQSILKRAFEGKLVPQDPADEPADVLLERIGVSHAAKPSTSKGLDFCNTPEHHRKGRADASQAPFSPTSSLRPEIGKVGGPDHARVHTAHHRPDRVRRCTCSGMKTKAQSANSRVFLALSMASASQPQVRSAARNR